MSKFFVTITTPCSQNWDEMTTAEAGKFCMHCNKTVIDFSRASDKEIARHIKKNKDENICGRFKEDQLNRWLYDSELRKINPAMYRFLAGVLLMMASQDISAQSRKTDSVEIISHPLNPDIKPIKNKKSSVTISTDNAHVFERSDIRIGQMHSIKGKRNDPMLIVDGTPTPLSYLSSIAPEDILTETLLKGSTAARIYGPEASDGVIIITTKKCTNEKACADDGNISP